MNGRARKGSESDDEDNATKIEAFICPITLEKFTNPVIAADGHTYEKKAILQWLETHNTSPLTGQKLTSKLIVNNFALKDCMEETQKKLKQQKSKLEQIKSELAEERSYSWWDLCVFGRHPIEEKEENIKRRGCCL